MQDFETTSTQSLMDRYYQEEKAQQERDLTLAALNVRLDANDLAMLNVISKRFRKTRDDVAQELLASALIDLFSRLETTERKLLARDADEAARSLANEVAEENGVHNLDVKTGVWANQERQLVKLERKQAKLAAQQSEQAAQEAQPNSDESTQPQPEEAHANTTASQEPSASPQEETDSAAMVVNQ